MTVPEKDTSLLTGGIILINKPLGWTSFDAVNKIRSVLRKYYGIRKIKVGHAGTLDPLASGLVIICTGRMTKEISNFQSMEKEYVAEFMLGKTTPSFDLETEIDGEYGTAHITRELIERALEKFRGEFDQVPPLFSAKFIDGKRAYKRARRGDDIELPAARISIRELEIEHFDLPALRLRIACSKGTYIRSLARDLGRELGSGAYLSSLERTRIGEYRLEDAVSPEQFQKIYA
ncbi:MAG: tRNA pseudouridine(55) synthase TruB [Marinilabiliales bacterium]|nr:MAG: tRNA pseudouridine(55) synthase TruB [Marinilabiliales bacterium]